MWTVQGAHQNPRGSSRISEQLAQPPAVRKEGVSWALEHSSALSIPPSDKKNTIAQNRVPASRQMDWKAGFFFTQSILSSQTTLNKMFPHLIHAAITKCRCTLHNRENAKVLVGYMQLEDCMGFSGCYSHQLYLDLWESDTILFNTALVSIEGFLGILWEVTKKQRFIGDSIRGNEFLWSKKKEIVTWQLYYSAVKQFPPIFQLFGQ